MSTLETRTYTVEVTVDVDRPSDVPDEEELANATWNGFYAVAKRRDLVNITAKTQEGGRVATVGGR